VKVGNRTRCLEANSKWIAGKAVLTGTNWIMFDDSAIRISTTGASTGVLALLIQASKIEGTI